MATDRVIVSQGLNDHGRDGARMKKPKRLYSFHGEMLTMAAISRRLGVNANTLWARIHVTGLTPEEAFDKPRCAPGQSYEKVAGLRSDSPRELPGDPIPPRAQGIFNWRMLTELERLERRQQDLARDISCLKSEMQSSTAKCSAKAEDGQAQT